MFCRLSEEAKKDEAVRHALSVRAAVTSGNYVMFFRLYKTAPNMNSCLMGEGHMTYENSFDMSGQPNGEG